MLFFGMIEPGISQINNIILEFVQNVSSLSSFPIEDNSCLHENSKMIRKQILYYMRKLSHFNHYVCIYINRLILKIMIYID